MAMDTGLPIFDIDVSGPSPDPPSPDPDSRTTKISTYRRHPSNLTRPTRRAILAAQYRKQKLEEEYEGVPNTKWKAEMIERAVDSWCYKTENKQVEHRKFRKNKSDRRNKSHIYRDVTRPMPELE